jgi:hypothetical protein
MWQHDQDADDVPDSKTRTQARRPVANQEAFNREENRRWELTTNHWDLPIHVVKVDAAG